MTTPTPPDFTALHRMIDELRAALRPVAVAAMRATTALRDVTGNIADARLAEVLGIPRVPHGLTVTLSSHVADGKMWLFTPPGAEPTLILGTYRAPARPFGAPGKTDVTDEARLIVRRGMADELEWLGQDPEWLGRSEQILTLLRSGTRARIPAGT